MSPAEASQHLDALFRAWREDIESEVFPTFVELLVPKGQQR